MSFSFCSFASGSSGNCYLIKSDHTALLVDVGITGRDILQGLEDHQVPMDSLDAILLTHEHTDHVRSIRMLGRKASGAVICGSSGTLSCVEDRLPPERTIIISQDDSFQIGEITVNTFPLSHDAVEPTGYSFNYDGKTIAIVTDTGIITEEIYEKIADADLLVLEANHEVNILLLGPYPYPLKQRILGEAGHLSNETAGKVICRMLKERSEEREMLKVLLAHLSKENNTPQHAYLAIKNQLFEEDLYVGRDLSLDVLLRDEMSPLIEV